MAYGIHSDVGQSFIKKTACQMVCKNYLTLTGPNFAKRNRPVNLLDTCDSHHEVITHLLLQGKQTCRWYSINKAEKHVSTIRFVIWYLLTVVFCLVGFLSVCLFSLVWILLKKTINLRDGSLDVTGNTLSQGSSHLTDPGWQNILHFQTSRCERMEGNEWVLIFCILLKE